jgi:mannose-6-phosphate isomerase-like protein (cupin superfamily)
VARGAPGPLTSEVLLRDVTEGDLPIFFEQQLDPNANRMAAFTARDPADWDAFTARWTRILHRHHDETFYVLEGELTVRVETRKITAPTGSFVVVPRGTVHQPSNPGTEPTRVLIIFSPAGMDHFLAAPTDPRVQEKLTAFTEKYGYEFPPEP